MRKPHDVVRRRLLLGATALGVGLMLSRRVASADFSRPIEIGLMPYMPTSRLIEAHQSLRRHIEETFKRQAVLSTAPDFQSFQRRVLRGDFDLVLSGGNLAWQAHLDAGMVPIAVSRKFVIVRIVVGKDSRITSIADLRGKTVATIDAFTTVAQITVRLLREGGLEVGRDVQLLHEKTPFNSAQAVVFGEAAAAGLPDISFRALTPEIRGGLRVIKESAPLPGVIFLSRQASDIPSPGQFQAALFRYAHETPAGRAYLKDLGHDGLVRPDFKRLKVLDSLVPEVRRMLAQP
jgi:ABC-type phosphate/phosphonate transport system substrate-binding protein